MYMYLDCCVFTLNSTVNQSMKHLKLLLFFCVIFQNNYLYSSTSCKTRKKWCVLQMDLVCIKFVYKYTCIQQLKLSIMDTTEFTGLFYKVWPTYINIYIYINYFLVGINYLQLEMYIYFWHNSAVPWPLLFKETDLSFLELWLFEFPP